jgi:hypothetical protein
MSVSDAEHQTRPENQYFVDTGVGPLDALYMWNRARIKKKSEQERIKTEQERRIQALETQIAELQGQLEPATELAKTRQTQIAELKKQYAELTTQNAELTTQNAELTTQNAELKTQNAQSRQGLKIMRLQDQISNLSTDIDKLENSRLQNLCKETTFACQLLTMTVNSVPQDIVKQNHTFFVLAKTIQRYIEEHASQAAELLIQLQRQTDHLGYLKDGHGLDTSSLSKNQQEFVNILLIFMYDLQHNAHFKEHFRKVYVDVMQNYYNTHASTLMKMYEADNEVKKLLAAEQRIIDLS